MIALQFDRISTQIQRGFQSFINSSFVQKVWRAVSEFFQFIAQKLKSCFDFLLEKLKMIAISIGIISPIIPQSLVDKLEKYNRTLPGNDSSFMKKAYDLMIEEIENKKPEMLEEFKEHIINFTDPALLMLALIRAYLFSDKECYFPNFFKQTLKAEMKIQFKVMEFNTFEPIIKDLKGAFHELPYPDQESIIETLDFDSTDLESKDAQNFIKKLGKICEGIIRDNQTLFNAHRATDFD